MQTRGIFMAFGTMLCVCFASSSGFASIMPLTARLDLEIRSERQ